MPQNISNWRDVPWLNSNYEAVPSFYENLSIFSKSVRCENKRTIIFKRSQNNTVLVLEILFVTYFSSLFLSWWTGDDHDLIFIALEGQTSRHLKKVPQRFPPFILDAEFLTALIFVFFVHLISSCVAANGENIYSPQIPQRLAQGTEDFHFQ